MAVADWSFLSALPAMQREADVETSLVLPLLYALGHSPSDVRPKYPVTFQKGGKFKRTEADFVVFSRTPHSPLTSLLTVEVKHPKKKVDDPAKAQADSYAFSLRCPFILLTNGVDIAVWQLQLVGPTECVLQCRVDELPARHGELEALLSKDAALAHCSKLSWKKVLFDEIDVMPYLDRVVQDAAQAGSGIRRELVVGTSARVEMEWALEQPLGAVVAAPSGFGKSTLCGQLAGGQASRVLRGESRALPVGIYLPDLIAAGEPVLLFARKRVGAHVPSLAAEGAFTERLRRDGAIVICDGFDRIGRAEKSAVEAAVRVVQRDLPKVRFIFSTRPRDLPALGLPEGMLGPLSGEEQNEIAAAKGVKYLSYRLSHGMREACKNAYLLTRVLARLSVSQSTAGLGDLPSLLREYIHEPMSQDRLSPQRAIQCQKALRVLALHTIEGPIEGTAALSLLAQAHVPNDTLDDLTRYGLVTYSSSGIELVHEVAADFLRAEAHAKMSDADLLQELESYALPSGSTYPLFLAALIDDPSRQSIVLNKISARNLKAYFGAVHHRAPISNASTEWHLSEILHGFVAPTETWCDARRVLALRASSSESEAGELSILGTTKGGSAVYAYVLSKARSVLTGDPLQETIVHASHLRRQNGAIDGGRDLGTRDLKETLLKVIKDHGLAGGPTWRRERLRFRLGKIDPEGELEGDALTVVREKLQDVADGYVALDADGIRPERLVRGAELVEDIDMLIANGDQSLAETAYPVADASPAGTANWSAWFSDEALSKLIATQYQRALAAYREVVEASFGTAACLFSQYQVLPIRYAIELERDRLSVTCYDQWTPVPAWEECAVEARVVPEASCVWRLEDMTKLQAELAKLGRTPERFSLGGGRTLHHEFATGGGVLELVTEWLLSDVESLFSP